MASRISQVQTGNTFINWIATTQKLVGYVPYFINEFNNVGNTVYANTNLNLAYDLVVSGNVTISDDVLIGQGVYKEVNVSGDANVSQNIVSINTSSVDVGTDAYVYGQLNVDGNFLPNNDSTLSITIDYLNSSNANITTLIGTANTNIYDAIDNSQVAANVANELAAYTAFVLALG